jgi:4-hydroxy-2-oxoheptanedioate aldolase
MGGNLTLWRDSLNDKIEAGKPALGLYANDVYTIDLMGKLGFDWIMIDQMFMPHDWSVTDQLVRACEAAGITPVVRLQSNPWIGFDPRIAVDLSRVLGIGVQYVMISNSGLLEIEQALTVAQDWHRKALYIHPFNSFEEWEQGIGEMEKRTWIIPQPESEGALAEFHETMAVPGLAAFFIAMTDASRVLTKSRRPDWYNDKLWEFVDAAVVKGRSEGIVIGANTSYAYDMEEMVARVKRLSERGVQMILCQGAPFLLQLAASKFLRDIDDALR